MIAYDAILQGDNNVDYTGYKAVNIIGLINAAGERTTITGKSMLIDASIRGLEIDAKKARDFLIFRLAESITTIVVHRKVKDAVEKAGFPHIQFIDPGNFISL